MKTKPNKLTLAILMLVPTFLLLLHLSCEGEGVDIPHCTIPVNIEVLGAWDSVVGRSTGSISVEATRGNGGYEYSLNGGAFQSSGEFIDLAGGDYTVVARDRQGCSNSVLLTINEVEVPSFANVVLPIVEMSCSIRSCHDGRRQLFQMIDYADIIPRVAAMRLSVTNRTMPPRGRTALTDAQINSIVTWIDGDAPNN
ncbi:MAG: hypothetical protein HEP71_05285 [Roseivirga sp.]|nr:hypothetical protein [Roseivirga sp.]